MESATLQLLPSYIDGLGYQSVVLQPSALQVSTPPQDNHPYHTLDLSYLSKANDSGIDTYTENYSLQVQPQQQQTDIAAISLSKDTAIITGNLPLSASASVTYLPQPSITGSDFNGSKVTALNSRHPILPSPNNVEFVNSSPSGAKSAFPFTNSGNSTELNSASSLLLHVSTLKTSLPLPLPTRIAMLQMQFVAHPDPVTAQQIGSKYHTQAAQIEAVRLQACTCTEFHSLQITMQYYDQLHLNLIKEIEESLDRHKKQLSENTELVEKVHVNNIQPSYNLSGGTPSRNLSQEDASCNQTMSPYSVQESTNNLHGLSTSTPIVPRSSCSYNSTVGPIAVGIMKLWYQQNASYPYPSRATMLLIAEQGGITLDQVKKWFCNRRQRAGFTRKNPQLRLRGKKRAFDKPEELLRQEILTEQKHQRLC